MQTIAPIDSKFAGEDLTQQTLNPDGSASLRTAFGAVLKYDNQGKIVGIYTAQGNDVRTFSYDRYNALSSFTNRGYALHKTDEGWTDGVQTFGLEILVDNSGNSRIIDSASSTVTSLNLDGSFVITISQVPERQYSIHHCAHNHNFVSQVDYPDGTKRTFKYGQHGQLMIVDETNGFWIRSSKGWTHYTARNRADGLRARDINIDFNGTLTFEYSDGARDQYFANGQTVCVETKVAA